MIKTIDSLDLIQNQIVELALQSGYDTRQIDSIMAAISDHINAEIAKARLSERAWAYKNMRDHGTDPQWVEVAKLRYEKALNLKGGKHE